MEGKGRERDRRKREGEGEGIRLMERKRKREREKRKRGRDDGVGETVRASVNSLCCYYIQSCMEAWFVSWQPLEPALLLALSAPLDMQAQSP